MTLQAPDTVIICGHRFELERLGYLPADHPEIRDLSKPGPEGSGMRLPKSSALHRGYTAEWEIREDGSLHLTSLTDAFRMKGGPLHANWVHSLVFIPVGEVDETRFRASPYQIVREMELQLEVTRGVVTKWRILKGSGKGARWKPDFDWPQIVAALAAHGIVPDFQPPRYKPSRRFSAESHSDLAKASADLLERARRGEVDTGKVLTDEDWDMLRRGWADPFPKLDFHDAVRAFRGHGLTQPPEKP